MGAKGSKDSFNRQAEARQSQKKTYQKFRQSITKLTKEVKKVKIQNKEKLLELEIAIKSAANNLEIAKTYTEPAFEAVFEDFLKNCVELDKIVKDKLVQNDKHLEESIQENEQPPINTQNIDVIEQETINISTIQNIVNIETAVFAENIPKPDEDVKKDKKKKKQKEKGDDSNQTKEKKSKNKKKADSLEVNSLLSEGEAENSNDEVVTSKKDKKKDKEKKSKKPKHEADDNVSRDTLDADQVLTSEKDKKKNKEKKSKKTKHEVDDNTSRDTSLDVDQLVTSEKDKKKDKVKNTKKNKHEVDDNTSRDTLDVDEFDIGSPITHKKRFWSLPIRLKRKSSAVSTSQEPVILIQDPENEDRSLQNIEIQQLEKAIKNNHKKDKIKRQSRAQSQFFDQQSDVPPTPSSTPVPSPRSEPQQQDALQQIHNIRQSISTLEEITKIYRLTKRGNYDYIYDNLCLCINKLKDMEEDQNIGIMTLRHEKKLAMNQAQECIDVLEGKVAVPERLDGRRSLQDDLRNSSGGYPQVVIARTPSKKRDTYQKSVEFIDITNNGEIIDIPLQKYKELKCNEDIPRDFESVCNNGKDLERLENNTQDSIDDFSEDDDLKDILMSLEDSTEEISQDNAASTKPVLITSF